jgi:hypothetical protein
MARMLSVSRVVVSPENQAEYLQAIHALAGLVESRRQRLWVFRSARQADTFIEFSESPSLTSHRTRASRTDLELRLEQRLREIGRYAPDAWELWEEIPPPPPGEPAEPGDDPWDEDSEQ